jgi:hypothetical protein
MISAVHEQLMLIVVVEVKKLIEVQKCRIFRMTFIRRCGRVLQIDPNEILVFYYNQKLSLINIFETGLDHFGV